MTVAASAEGRVLRLEITEVVSPVFDGAEFGSAGRYEMLYGRAYGEVDPADRRNALITDITLAPRNARGMVEYWTDVHILKPVDVARGNGRLILDVVNRGNKFLFGFMNRGIGSNQPLTAAHAGDGYAMRMGYSVVWVGWEAADIRGEGDHRAVAGLPVAKNADGSPVVATLVFETAFNDRTTRTIGLVFPPATRDRMQASIMVRNHSSDAPVPVPARDWAYVGDTRVLVNRNSQFLSQYDRGAAYQFTYPARDPVVGGLGFAATRDVVAFLRHEQSRANPLFTNDAGRVQWVLAHGTSQSGSMLRSFLYWGFNEDEGGRTVIDGMNVHIAGTSMSQQNIRFGDANVGPRPYLNHTNGRLEFPFTYQVLTDPLTGRTDGLLARCTATRTCPKIIHTDSGNEVWFKASSLITTDGAGHDLVLPDTVRVYYLASTQHVPLMPPEQGICQQLNNPLNWGPNLKALFTALDAWVTHDTPPPPSQYPRVSDGTYVSPLPRSGQGFPDIPGVTYNGLYNRVPLLDRTVVPYRPVDAKEYRVFVPKVDADGNDVAGVRPLDLQVPLATYTGWALRKEGYAEGEDCDLNGQYIPFPMTRAERMETNDPRPSVEERYKDHQAYETQYQRAAAALVKARLLLDEDAQRLIEVARTRPLSEPEWGTLH